MGLNHQAITAFRTVLPYSVFGAAWIWGSDKALLLFTQDPATLSQISTYKGLAFIIVTSTLLFLLVLRKIHELEILHMRLDKRRNELQEFVYAASHQLRTPLLTISGFAGEIADGVQTKVSTEEMNHSVNMIQKGVRQLEGILKGLSRLHRHLRNDPKPARINVDQVVRRILQQINVDEGDSSLSADVSELPPCYADPDHIEVMLHEIIENAVRHSHKHQQAHLWISGQVIRKTAVYEFRDDGPGFSNENLSQLMNPILRKQTSHDTGALQIGLAIASRCAQWNQGHLMVTTNKGHGTCIRIELPFNH